MEAEARKRGRHKHNKGPIAHDNHMKTTNNQNLSYHKTLHNKKRTTT